jgi:hypothetical protein
LSIWTCKTCGNGLFGTFSIDAGFNDVSNNSLLLKITLNKGVDPLLQYNCPDP